SGRRPHRRVVVSPDNRFPWSAAIHRGMIRRCSGRGTSRLRPRGSGTSDERRHEERAPMSTKPAAAAPFEPKAPAVLAVDVGGSHVKLLLNGDGERRRFVSGKKFTAAQMVAGVIEHAREL